MHVVGGGQVGLKLRAAEVETLPQGSVVVIKGVYALNRITGKSTKKLRQFVLLQDVGPHNSALPIYPHIIPKGRQYATVITCPADGAEIKVVGQVEMQLCEMLRLTFLPRARQSPRRGKPNRRLTRLPKGD